jgi:hypothetical protein
LSAVRAARQDGDGQQEMKSHGKPRTLLDGYGRQSPSPGATRQNVSERDVDS